jgi:predicted  nucleic acid-binding Zn-ribbon protein
MFISDFEIEPHLRLNHKTHDTRRTEFMSVQQMVISRHDQEFDTINATLANTNATLDRVAAQQEATARQSETFNQRIEAMERQSAINQEAIATLTASI